MAGRFVPFNTYTALSSDASGSLETSEAYSYIATLFQGPLSANTTRADFRWAAAIAQVAACMNNSNGYNAPTYGATVTPNAQYEVNTIIPTDTVAYTVANPSNDTYAQTLTLRFLNSSGGTMGDVTFGSEYKLATTYAKPANGTVRYYVFSKTAAGTWEEVSRTATDITP